MTIRNFKLKASALLCASALSFAAFAAPVQAETTSNKQVDEQHIWDLTDFYPNKQAWEDELKRLRSEIDSIDAYKGKLGKSAKTLLAALDAKSTYTKEVMRVWTYASNMRNTNLGDATGQEMVGRLQALFQDASAKASFMSPEIVAIGQKRIEKFIKSEPGLEKHAFYLRNVIRKGAHVLSPETEKVLSMMGTALSASQNARDFLANAEIEWPRITLSDGTEAHLTNAGYSLHRAAANRDDRVAVFDAFWGTYKDFESTLGATLNGEVQANVAMGKARKYDNTLQYFLSGDNIPEEVYRTLVKVTNERIDVLHRYFELRARMLGVDDLGYHDIYPDLVETDLTFPIDKTREYMLASLDIMGQDYKDKFAKASVDRWMHVYPQPGKRSGAYMSGSAYDVHPLVLLNHLDNYNSASTYAHEWGHALHQVLTNENQPYELSGFSIFTTEIAAIAKEIILQEHLLEQAKTEEEKLFYLGYALEQMRGTFFRQVMFSEFELATHEAVERGEALTGARMTQIYGEILKRYHGHDKGVMKIEERDMIEWAYIPHFYYNFYVYQYATSIAGAAYFVDQLKTGGDEARETYLNFLKAGGSDYPVEILKDAGLDMTSAAPYNSVINRMDAVMDEIEAILNKREK
ncbi:oligoendopeptidase F [Catenovulum sp. SM1970]|uniref:oligoendopeptidase F n=1 Tax=Marinifaba aquimaris TaxID=2741323 RepID=UPI0015741A87|nr:oligoendopeptidase F [Marinifaba aquimaris]NTS77171.1 oligoendopeptidase F [Marinifaba aquimaris]